MERIGNEWLTAMLKMSRTWHMNNGETGLRLFIAHMFNNGIINEMESFIYDGWEESAEYQDWVIEKSFHKALIRWEQAFLDWLWELTVLRYPPQ